MSENVSHDDPIWQQDRLGRSKDAIFLKTFLINRLVERRAAGLAASYVLNIDARWGQGKSFFLERFGLSLKAEGFLVASVNAWQDDHADDPLLSVMTAIDEAVAPFVKREKQALERWNAAKRTGAAIAVAAAKGAVIQIAKKAIGAGVDEIATILDADIQAAGEKSADEISKSLGEIIGNEGKALLERFREGKRTIARFRRSLADFLKVAEEKEQSLPLFVLIDELDRCRPPFAIAMLERIKHLFEIDQVVFVLATDTVQLSHSVGAVYGSDFNSEGYLSRFFNRTYHFERIPRKEFIEGLFAELPLDVAKISLPTRLSFTKYLSDAFDFFALPLRDIEQVYDVLRSIVTTWKLKIKIELVVLLPIIVAYQQRMDLPLDGNFSAVLNRIAQKNDGGRSPLAWRISFVNSQTYPAKDHFVDGVSLANDFVGHIGKAFPDVNYEVTSPHSKWVALRLGEEFTLLHGNAFRRDAPPYSVIRQYPDMVRTAGRLSPQNLQLE